MSYSRQVCNGTVVENKDGDLYVNGKHIETGKRTLSSVISTVVIYGFFFILGYVCGM